MRFFLGKIRINNLAAHLSMAHGTDNPRMIWCYDIDLLIRHYVDEIDLGELLEQARLFGWSRVIYQALYTVKQRFGTEIPAEVIEALAKEADQSDDQLYFSDPEEFARQYVRQSMGSLSRRGRLSVMKGALFLSAA